mgnify:CR=1 FL=1
MNQHDFYQKVKNWDFSNIKYVSDTLTNWDMYEELRKSVNYNNYKKRSYPHSYEHSVDNSNLLT